MAAFLFSRRILNKRGQEKKVKLEYEELKKRLRRFFCFSGPIKIKKPFNSIKPFRLHHFIDNFCRCAR